MPLITGLVQFETNTTNSLVSLDNNFTIIANAVNGFATIGITVAGLTSTAGASISGGDVTIASPPSGVALTVNGLGGASAPYPMKVIGSTSSTPGTGSSVQLQAYQASWQVINAAGTQNWYFGVNDADSNNLWIGNGYSAAQGLTAAIKVSASGLATFVNTDNSGAYLEVGYRDAPNSTNVSGTLALTDRGKSIPMTSNWTIPANGSVAFPVGTVIIFTNLSGSAKTISITTDTLFSSLGAGNRTLANASVATIAKGSSTQWFITGFGLT